MIVQAETAELADMTLAKEVAETLHAHYPGHMWAVTIKDGALVIKNLLLSSLWGMVLHMKNIADAGVRKKRVIRAGGEFLERANLQRGAYREQEIGTVEGIKGKR